MPWRHSWSLSNLASPASLIPPWELCEILELLGWGAGGSVRLKTCLTILAGILLSLTSVPSAHAQALLAPVFTKAFGALFIPVNGATTLTFTIKNPNPVALTNVQFVDHLPFDMSRTNLSFGSSTCGTVDISNVVQEQPFTLAANST